MVQEDKTRQPTRKEVVNDDDEIKRTLALLGKLKKQAEQYTRLASAAADGRYLDAERALKRTPNPTSRFLELLGNLQEAIQNLSLESTVLELSKRARLRYHETLEQCFDQASLQRSGQWPTYVISDTVRVHIDLDRVEAIVDGKKVGTLEPGRIIEQVKVRLKELFNVSFDPEVFLSLLRSGYDKVAEKYGQTLGGYVDLREVFAIVRTEMEHRGGRYPESKFAADLYQLCSKGMTTTPDRLRLEFSPAQNAAGGLYIPAQGGGNYIASLRFVRKQNDV